MSGYWPWLLSRSSWVIILLGTVSALLLPALQDLQIDSSPSALIVSDSPQNIYHQEFRRIFGNDEILLIGLTVEDLLQPETLASIRKVTETIEGLPGVKRVLSLTNVLDILDTNGEVTITPLIPDSVSSLNLDALRLRLRNNPLYQKELISSDLRTTALFTFFENPSTDKGKDVVRQLVPQIRNIVKPLKEHGHVFIGGVPEMEYTGMENMIRDLWVFTPITLGLVMVILIINSRSGRGIALPLLAISLTLIWTLAAMSLSDHPLKPTTLVLPSLLIANGSAYVIHLLAHYYQTLLRAYSKVSCPKKLPLNNAQYHRVLLDTLSRAHTPIAISAATTMAGFSALGFNHISAIRDLGLFAVLGVFLSYFFCIHLIPRILLYLPVPRQEQIPGHESSHRHTFFEKLSSFNLNCRHWIYLFTGLSIALALFGAFQVKVRTDYLSNFHKSSPLVEATRAFQKQLAGLSSFSIVIGNQGESLVTEAATLAAVNHLQKELQQLPGVDRSLSIVDSIKLLNQATHNNQPAFFKLPLQQDVLDEMLELLESDPSEATQNFISEDHKNLRILVRSSVFESTKLRALIKEIQDRAIPLLPQGIDFHITGTLVLMNLTSDQLAIEQMKSLLLSVLFIATILIFIFRSFKVGLLCLIPGGLPVLMFFGLIGWNEISLNVNTSVIAAITIGIGVDNCVQYMIYFRRCQLQGLLLLPSIRESLIRAGGPMCAATVVVVLGFLVFGLSRFAPVSQFGLLSAFTMGFNLITNLTLLPALLMMINNNPTEGQNLKFISPKRTLP